MAPSELTIRENQVSEITLSYKPRLKPFERLKISCSSDAREVFVKVWDENKIEFVEEFKGNAVKSGQSGHRYCIDLCGR